MKIRYILYSLCILLGCICFSCTDMTDEQLSPIETGLTIQINTGDSFSRGEYNESNEKARDNVINHVDIFIFDTETGTLVENCYWHFNEEQLKAQPITLISGNWKTRFVGHSVCQVYVVANLHAYTNETDYLKRIQTLNDLESTLTDQDDYIYRAVADLEKDKLFTMTGNKQDWHPADEANVCILNVNLTRLAAKVEITLTLNFSANESHNEDGVDYEYPKNGDINSLSYSVQNYVTTAQVLPGNDKVFNRSFSSSSEANIQYITSIDQKAKIVFYTYPNEWTDDILKETYVIFNAKLNKKEGVPANDPKYYLNNYYKIPLRYSIKEQKLERNHWYKVNATISALGNTSFDDPIELTDVQYEVAEWKNMPIEVSGDNPMYLELSEYEVVMRNVDTYDLTFASSSDLVKGIDENAEIEIKDIYYYNKNGEKITITDTEILDKTYLKVEGDLNGKLTIHSPIPANKTIRYIELTVKNKQYKENDSGTFGCIKTVTVMQYPLEYITGIAGLYSYLENDNRYKGKWPEYTKDYDGNEKNDDIIYLSYDGNGYSIDKNVDSKIKEGLNHHIGDGVDMKCKFYIENDDGIGRIFRIDLSYLKKNEDENKLVSYLEDNGESASNNRMYHVVITSTSDEYKLARPPMTSEDENATVIQNEINNEFVSPSFMLASQLGNSSAMSWSEAEKQCQDYVEVGMNGKEYNDWRLPTLEEIKIIKKYQEETPDVMDAVLEIREKNEKNENANPYYWTAIKDVYIYTGNATAGTPENKKCRVRCVRDFHIGEPTE